MTLVRWRRLPWLAGLGVFGVVMTWTLLVTPRYRSAALVRVQDDPGSSGLSDALAAMPGASMLGLSRDEVESEIGVFTSRRVIDAVIDSLALTVRDPAGGRSEIGSVVLRDTDDVEGVLRFRREESGRWSIEAKFETPIRSLQLPASVSKGDTLRIGGVWIVFAPRGDAMTQSVLRLRLLPRFKVREQLRDRLDVRRQELGSRLIAISFDDADRVLATQVVERMLEEYLAFTARADRSDLSATATSLRRQIASQREALATAEEALRRYQERSGLVIPEEQAIAQVKRYAALRAEMDAAEVERGAVTRMLELTEASAAQTRSPEAYRQLATYPSLLTNRAIQDLLAALLALENTRSQRQILLADESREIRQVTARIAEIETSLQRLGTQYLEALDVRSRSLRTALDSLDREIEVFPREEMQYLRLFRERTVLNEGYLLLQKQLRQTEVREALRLDQLRVVDRPTIAHPDDPQFPKVWVHLVLALVLGCSMGFGVAAFQRGLMAEAP